MSAKVGKVRAKGGKLSVRVAGVQPLALAAGQPLISEADARALSKGISDLVAAHKASKSGPNQTDEQRAERGLGRITLRLPQGLIDQLGLLAHERGLGRAELVAELVSAAAERAERRKRFT